jgi:hypothetical protein
MDDWTWFAFRLPLCAVCIIGFILAVVGWQRHPTTSLLTVLGVGILGFNSLVWWIVPDRLLTTDNLAYFIVRDVAKHLMTAAGVALLVAAVFSSRSQRPGIARDTKPNCRLPANMARPPSSAAPDGAFREGSER